MASTLRYSASSVRASVRPSAITRSARSRRVLNTPSVVSMAQTSAPQTPPASSQTGLNEMVA